MKKINKNFSLLSYISLHTINHFCSLFNNIKLRFLSFAPTLLNIKTLTLNKSTCLSLTYHFITLEKMEVLT